MAAQTVDVRGRQVLIFPQGRMTAETGCPCLGGIGITAECVDFIQFLAESRRIGYLGRGGGHHAMQGVDNIIPFERMTFQALGCYGRRGGEGAGDGLMGVAATRGIAAGAVVVDTIAAYLCGPWIDTEIIIVAVIASGTTGGIVSIISVAIAVHATPAATG